MVSRDVREHPQQASEQVKWLLLGNKNLEGAWAGAGEDTGIPFFIMSLIK